MDGHGATESVDVVANLYEPDPRKLLTTPRVKVSGKVYFTGYPDGCSCRLSAVGLIAASGGACVPADRHQRRHCWIEAWGCTASSPPRIFTHQKHLSLTRGTDSKRPRTKFLISLLDPPHSTHSSVFNPAFFSCFLYPHIHRSSIVETINRIVFCYGI